MREGPVLTDQERRVLATLADLIAPRSEGMPSASDVDVPGRGIDRVLRSRPDLHEPLIRLLAAIPTPGSVEELEDILAGLPGALDVLATVILGAYYLEPSVHERLGYPGQVAREIDLYEYPVFLDEGDLDPVVSRGPIYRSVHENADHTDDLPVVGDHESGGLET